MLAPVQFRCVLLTLQMWLCFMNNSYASEITERKIYHNYCYSALPWFLHNSSEIVKRIATLLTTFTTAAHIVRIDVELWSHYNVFFFILAMTIPQNSVMETKQSSSSFLSHGVTAVYTRCHFNQSPCLPVC